VEIVDRKMGKTWQHEHIILHPLNPAYKPIVIPESESESFTVIAEFVGIVPR
jgi:SOS-response transcriptional repressor LexA